MTDPFQGLRQRLESELNWPQLYMFKFIIANDNHKLAQVQALFGEEAQVTISQSREGKYVSISAREMMLNAAEVIARYEQANLIGGVISL